LFGKCVKKEEKTIAERNRGTSKPDTHLDIGMSMSQV
jgi:hypothetical protein